MQLQVWPPPRSDQMTRLLKRPLQNSESSAAHDAPPDFAICLLRSRNTSLFKQIQKLTCSTTERRRPAAFQPMGSGSCSFPCKNPPLSLLRELHFPAALLQLLTAEVNCVCKQRWVWSVFSGGRASTLGIREPVLLYRSANVQEFPCSCWVVYFRLRVR